MPSEPTTARTDQIHLRIAGSQRHLIDQAAAARQQTRTGFILDAALRAAEETLLDQRLFTLSPEQFTQIETLLDAPAHSNEALKALLSKTPAWG